MVLPKGKQVALFLISLTLVQTEQSKEDSDSTPDEDDDDSEIFRQRTRKRSIKFFSDEWVDDESDEQMNVTRKG